MEAAQKAKDDVMAVLEAAKEAAARGAKGKRTVCVQVWQGEKL